MSNVERMNPYPLKRSRASGTIAFVLFGAVGVLIVITQRNDVDPTDTSDDPVLAQIYITLSNLALAIALSLESRYLYLHRKWNIQQSMDSKVSFRLALCVSFASLFWIVGLAWLFGLSGPA